jgi:hypothetical protein
MAKVKKKNTRARSEKETIVQHPWKLMKDAAAKSAAWEAEEQAAFEKKLAEAEARGEIQLSYELTPEEAEQVRAEIKERDRIRALIDGATPPKRATETVSKENPTEGDPTGGEDDPTEVALNNRYAEMKKAGEGYDKTGGHERGKAAIGRKLREWLKKQKGLELWSARVCERKIKDW